MIDIESYINKYSEKLGFSVDEVRKDYEELLTEEKEIHTTLTEEEQKTRALQRLSVKYKRLLRSPAIGFEGIVMGLGDVVDTVARIRENAIKMFKENPQQAIANGLTDDEGNPLDTRETFSSGKPNPSYGKPLPEHNYLRNIFGVCNRIGESEPKFFTMTINGEVAKTKDIPLFTPVKFRANDKSEESSSTFTLTHSVFTKFEKSDINLPSIREIVSKFIGITNLADLQQYHTQHKDDYNRIVAIEGDVSMLFLEPTATGSRRMIIEDGSKLLEDLESPGITCWIPAEMDIDFSEGSKVIVVGRTTQGLKRDDNGQQTEELGDVMLNVYGIYCYPEFKINPPIKEITQENIPENVVEETPKVDTPQETKPEKDSW